MVDILRGEWGFNGFVVSDCGAITDIWKGHEFSRRKLKPRPSQSKPEPDLTCGREYPALIQAVKDGLLRRRRSMSL
jgi:beta-glucosidase